MPAKPDIKAFFDEPTNTVSYVVSDPATRQAVVIDPVLDYDFRSGKADVRSAECNSGLFAVGRASTRSFVLETHAHADHLSGAPYIKAKTGAKVVIGEHIRDVQRIFRPVFNATDISGDGSEFDRLVADGERLPLGELEIEVIATPGHTPACVSYKIADAVFVGDTLFMPDYGTARADFPGGDARTLYRSIQRLLSLPAADAPVHVPRLQGAGPRQLCLGDDGRRGAGAQCACRRRRERGRFRRHARARATQRLRRRLLLLPSIQVNIRAGQFPPAESNGVRYLKVPVKLAS